MLMLNDASHNEMVGWLKVQSERFSGGGRGRRREQEMPDLTVADWVEPSSWSADQNPPEPGRFGLCSARGSGLLLRVVLGRVRVVDVLALL